MGSCLHPRRFFNPRYEKSAPLSPLNFPEVVVPCGHCYFCRENKVNDLALRLKHERTSRAGRSVFVTFTFNDVHLPPHLKDTHYVDVLGKGEWIDTETSDYDFGKRELQNFYKRLRMRVDRAYEKGIIPRKIDFKVLSTGEFGHRHHRPHYHSLIVGTTRREILPFIKAAWTKRQWVTFPDGTKKYLSVPLGFVYVKNCDSNASFYCTKYMKKQETAVWYSNKSPIWFFRDSLKRLAVFREKALRGAFQPHACDSCPLLDGFRKCIILCQRLTKAEFNKRHQISFTWKSINLGKEMALFHREWATLGYVPNGRNRSTLPRTYKTYYINDYMLRNFRGMEYAPLTFGDVYVPSTTWLDSYDQMLDSSEYKDYLASLQQDAMRDGLLYHVEPVPIKEPRSLFEKFDRLQAFRLWTSQRQHAAKVSRLNAVAINDIINGKDYGL